MEVTGWKRTEQPNIEIRWTQQKAHVNQSFSLLPFPACDDVYAYKQEYSFTIQSISLEDLLLIYYCSYTEGGTQTRLSQQAIIPSKRRFSPF